MKNITLVIALILFSFKSSFSQNKPHTLLWEISKNSSSQKSYLFGTFHEVNPDFFDSIKVANEYLKKSKILLVEAYDAPNADSLKIKAQISSWNKAKWDSLLNVTQKEKFATYTKSIYGDYEMYKSSPQILMFELLRNYLQGICDTVNRKSFDLMDTRIINTGLKNNLKVLGLETDQIGIINEISKTEATFTDSNIVKPVLDLMNYITKNDTKTNIAKALFDYKKFDIDYQFNADSKSNDLFVTRRNNNWMKVIPNFIDKNPCFIAVGFRHLLQKKGLIEQLRGLGYTLKPIKI